MGRRDPFDLIGINNNILDRQKSTERQVAATARRNVSGSSLQKFSQEIGELELRLVDDNGKLRGVVSASSLYNELGIEAFLALLSAYGNPTAWMDADSGKIAAGGGSLTIGDDGLRMSGVPVRFDNDYYPVLQNLFGDFGTLAGVYGWVNALYESASLGSELLSDGSFEAGTWLPDSGTYEIVEHDGGLALQMDSGGTARQDLGITTADETGLYLLEADVYGDVWISVQINDRVTAGGDPYWTFLHVNNYSAWTRVRFIFSVDSIPLLAYGSGDYEIVLNGGGSYDNVSIKKAVGAIGMGMAGKRNRVYGGLPSAGNIYESGLYYTMPLLNNNVTNVTLTANRQYAIPFFVDREIVISSLAINVTTGATGKLAQAAIYKTDEYGVAAGEFLLASASVSMTGAAVKSFTVNARLQPGLYYLAVQSDGAPIVSGAAVGDGLGHQGYTALPTTRVTCKYKDTTYGTWVGGGWSNRTTTNPLVWALIA